jgi:hypothetical protein
MDEIDFSGKNLMVVAHPDDETMWGGSLPIRYPGNWTILCCSIPRRDPERAVLFKNACEKLGAEPRIIPVQESVNISGFHLPDGFDLVVTHNKAGEYGHQHHKQVHRTVTDFYDVPILTFGFGKGKIKIELNEEEYEQKLGALKEYSHELPYNGETMPKWKALLKNYEEVDFGTDTFDEYKREV